VPVCIAAAGSPEPQRARGHPAAPPRAQVRVECRSVSTATTAVVDASARPPPPPPLCV
jgi:hypothetical protein